MLKTPYPESGIRVLSIMFGEQWVEISFIEERDESDDVIDIKQRLISPSLFLSEITDIQDSVTELLDRASLHRRNPTQHYSRTRLPEESLHVQDQEAGQD